MYLEETWVAWKRFWKLSRTGLTESSSWRGAQKVSFATWLLLARYFRYCRKWDSTNSETISFFPSCWTWNFLVSFSRNENRLPLGSSVPAETRKWLPILENATHYWASWFRSRRRSKMKLLLRGHGGKTKSFSKLLSESWTFWAVLLRQR
jgi:hypothetical protein